MDGGRLFALINDKLGQLEGPQFGIAGDEIRLHGQECAVATAPVESVYRFKHSGGQLTFTKVKNGCKDKVSLTLITANPWTKK